MSSAPAETAPEARIRVGGLLPRHCQQLALVAVTLVWLLGCHAAAQGYRLNPGVEPSKYRVLCDESFKQCERKVKELCGEHHQELSRESNHPEPKEVEVSGVSSTAPSDGVPNWRGEMVVICGKAVKPLRLVREPDAPPTAPPAAGQGSNVARVCVPGVTQVCLGPGACSGAQACSADGTGFGACDCGSPAPASSSEPAGSDRPSQRPDAGDLPATDPAPATDPSTEPPAPATDGSSKRLSPATPPPPAPTTQ